MSGVGNGVYSNKHGFLGGYGWMLLVARIIQLFPNVTSHSELLFRFFSVYSTWAWSAVPVGLALGGKVPSYRMQPVRPQLQITSQFIYNYNN